MSTSKLALYNNALLHLEERRLANLTENREPRRALDDAYDVVTAYCNGRAPWKHTRREVQIASSASLTPAFGFQYAFAKPDDWVRTHRIADNGYFEPQLTRFADNNTYWTADCDPLFVDYVSSDTAYGMDLSRWSAAFAEYVALRLAVRTCKRITGNDAALDRLKKEEKDAFKVASGIDAMNGPPLSPPTGTWVRSRSGGWSNRSRWNGQIA